MKPKKVSEFPLKPALDGKGFIQIQEGAENKRISEQVILDALKKKVDAVEGRGLSEENYTTAEKEKLSQCVEVIDLVPILAEGRSNNGLITQESFDRLLRALQDRESHLFIFQNTVLTGNCQEIIDYGNNTSEQILLFTTGELANKLDGVVSLDGIGVLIIHSNLKPEMVNIEIVTKSEFQRLEERVRVLEGKRL